jgi:hypothetical protein
LYGDDEGEGEGPRDGEADGDAEEDDEDDEAGTNLMPTNAAGPPPDEPPEDDDDGEAEKTKGTGERRLWDLLGEGEDDEGGWKEKAPGDAPAGEFS